MSGNVLVYVAVGAGTAFTAAMVVLLIRVFWNRDVRKHILRLAGRRAEIDAATHALQEVMDRLAVADEGHLIAFALDADSEERQTLCEIAGRMRLAADDLAGTSLPRQLWQGADQLAQAASQLSDAVRPISDGDGAALLDALGRIDISAALEHLSAADETLSTLCERYGVDMGDIYGGGLYI